MKQRIWITYSAFIVLGFVLASVPQSRLAGQDKSKDSESAKWEYKVEIHRLGDDRPLIEIGEQGWELIAATAHNTSDFLYFKRRK